MKVDEPVLHTPISFRKYSLISDLVVVLLIGSTIYGLVSFGREWRSEFHPTTEIDLSIQSLPVYALLSTVRACIAYLLSLAFTLVVGFVAAKSKWAEKVIIPLLDILQSIPVLGFLPGLVFGLVALFPRTNMGLELAAIIMIFTGQAWNMTFSFYSSLKAIPTELGEASQVMGMSWRKRLLRLELPFSAVNLAWNSLMSMAGGWFFLSVCEAFTLGDRQFRLPGIGAYMAVAISEGDSLAMALGILTMVLIIVLMDVLIWRPVLAWVHKFRLEEIPGSATSSPFIQLMIRTSHIYRALRYAGRKLMSLYQNIQPDLGKSDLKRIRFKILPSPEWPSRWVRLKKVVLFAFAAIFLGVTAFMLWKVVALLEILSSVSWDSWVVIFKNTLWTLSRVLVTLILSSLWAVPVGIWIGMSPERVKIAQPITQVFASFPAPMLYPIAIGLLFQFGVSFDWGSALLMMLGAQWYILFNVLAGAMRIPQELVYVTDLFEVSAWKRWLTLYIPSVFPALVTGWVTAAGGAWNASIVAEHVTYRGGTLSTPGLGSTISVAASEANFPLLAASLAVMVFVVIALNRTVWAQFFKLSQTRFRMDS